MQHTVSHSSGALIAFIGSTPNIGTTITAVATAVRIAERSQKQIGYLCLNLKSSKLHRYIGVDQPIATLDQLQADLRAFSLSKSKLQQAMYSPKQLPKLSILFGNLSREQAEFYWPEHIEHLIRVAQQLYAVIIVDVSAYWDNAATITAMRLADTRVMITSVALSHFQEDRNKWTNEVAPLFQLSEVAFEYVTTHYPWKNGGFTMNQVQKQLQLKTWDQMKVSESLLAKLDQGTYVHWLVSDRSGQQLMNQGAATIMKRHQIPVALQWKKEQPWFRKLTMYRRNGARTL
ncbi:hypothetical protein ACFSTH_10665 [Paenibacillus yanchengensis]|uniref:ParA family protein n=1 Tax=Paenibacillus yanchengensis TaxID=2035833 RepID=A0ABW4YIY6_9BACL